MVWGKFDDQYPDHPKVRQVGIFGGWLQLEAISYCNRYLTDGFFSYATAEVLIAKAAASFYADGTSWSPAAVSGRVTKRASEFDWKRLMVEARLWDPVPDRGGYLIHDYPDYNPSREAVLAEREAAKIRKERWRERHPEHRSDSVQNGGGNGSGTATERLPERREYADPVPAPVPVPGKFSRSRPLDPAPAGFRERGGSDRAVDVGRGTSETPIRTEAEKLAKMRQLTASGLSEKDANFQFGKWLTGQEKAT